MYFVCKLYGFGNNYFIFLLLLDSFGSFGLFLFGFSSGFSFGFSFGSLSLSSCLLYTSPSPRD